jgi:GTP1/Obg family GTP-binding protein
LYEVPGPDGPITQKWRGMPKLPDLIETMLTLRSKRARETYRQQEEKRHEEQKQLEQRRAEHPEEFLGDFWERLKQENPELLQAAQTRVMPDVKMITTGKIDKSGLIEMEEFSHVLSNDEAANRRIEQMKADFEMHLQRKKASQ